MRTVSDTEQAEERVDLKCHTGVDVCASTRSSRRDPADSRVCIWEHVAEAGNAVQSVVGSGGGSPRASYGTPISEAAYGDGWERRCGFAPVVDIVGDFCR